MKVKISPINQKSRNPQLSAAAMSAIAPVDPAQQAADYQKLFSRLPILQFGKHYRLGDLISLEVRFDLWHKMQDLTVQYRTNNGPWRTRKIGDPTKIELDGVPERYHYKVRLTKLVPGASFEYLVLSNKEGIFNAVAKAPPARNQRFSIAITGDIGDGGPGATATAAGISKANPDMLLLTGDIVYETGRDSEYDPHFLSVYNANTADPSHGAPLLRSRAIAAAVGNHDMGFPADEKRLDLNKRPDLLGFFLTWHHPNNGPDLSLKKLLKFAGKKGKRDRLIAALGADFLSKANYSFDFGNVHCVVLDANKYMDWTSPDLRQWLKDDLESAHGATWKIVVWHQPPFNCDAKYHTDERMAVISPILEQYGVDLVFHGHCHFYQRTYPISVKLEGTPKAASNIDGTVNGTIYLDKEFDGVEKRSPNGIIYVVTGAGGHPASGEHMPIDMPFAAKVITGNSFTMLDVDGGTLTLRQMSVDNQLLDQVILSKEARAEVAHTNSIAPLKTNAA
jgi:3',5'-cyclic AMP phosphodiesterase CpdA